MPERMPKIVHPDVGQPGSNTRSFPAGVEYLAGRVALVREHELRMLTPLFIHDASRNRVQHNDPFLTILGLELVVARQHKHTCLKLRELHLPVPSELTHFLFPATGVDLVQGHPLQVPRQLPEQAVLFFPTQRIGLSCRPLLHLYQRW